MYGLNPTFYVEAALTLLLAVTLVYCIVLERRLSAVRKGQDGLKQTVRELNGAIAAAGASLRALKVTAGEAAANLDEKLRRARLHIDELSVLTISGERIAERIEQATVPRVAARSNAELPSGSVMSRLDRAAQPRAAQ